MLKIKKYANNFKMELYGCFRMIVNSKTFSIPILTAIVFLIKKEKAVRIGIANAIELIFVL